jgi:hypothetical protein
MKKKNKAYSVIAFDLLAPLRDIGQIALPQATVIE